MNHGSHEVHHEGHGTIADVMPKRSIKDFYPLIGIFAIILAITGFAISRHGGWDALYAMRVFEASFFIIFGGFKLLNWKGFVMAFRIYDILAIRSRTYAYMYPLIEIAFGLGYAFNLYFVPLNIAVIVILSIGAFGVWKKLQQHEEVPCACLGVVFKLPMTYVTLLEDLLMIAMASAMLYLS